MTFKIWGTEDVVRSSSTWADRDALSMLANGGYVVTFHEGGKIFFQLYNGSGDKVVGPIDVGASSIVAAAYADVQSVDAGGSFVVAWTQEVNNVKTLFMRKFNANGSPANDAIPIVTGTSVGHGAKVSAGPDGGWAITYTEIAADATTHARMVSFSADGVLQGGITDLGRSGTMPDITYVGQDQNAAAKYVAIYQTSGFPTKFDFTFTNGTTPQAHTVDATRADVVALRNPDGSLSGKFAIVAENGRTDIKAYVYNADGSLDNTIAIGGGKSDSSDYSTVIALRNGGFAVAYAEKSTNPDGTPDDGDIFVRVIGADGSVGQPLKINARWIEDRAGGQSNPTITEMADGRLAIAWHDGTIGAGLISATIFDARTTSVTVLGTAHNDVYAPSEHAGDNLDGSEGIDTLTFKGTTTGGVSVNLGTESGSAGDATGDTYKNFENVIGSKFNDTITGSAGINRLEGGAGNDTYTINDTNDVVVETSTGGTADLVYASASYTLSSYVEKLYAQGSASISLTGNAQANTIKGNGGANKINGGYGKDTLYGGSGKDVFVFSTKPSSSNLDKIADYNVSYDSIYLENAVFTKLGSGSASSPKKLSSSAFWKGSKAHDASDRIIYDAAKGYLYYDADGTGASKQVLIATLAKNLKMTYAEFFVI